MSKPYSLDLRERMVAAIEAGLSCNRAAKQFGVGISTAINWAKRVRETGSIAPGEPQRLVFIDEAWSKTNMAPLRGRAPRGQRFVAKVPHRRWTTTTFVAALRLDRIEAPWLLEGPIDGESFRTYIARVLLPTLREGDIVIMHNLGSHKGKAVRELIRSTGAKLFFLPKYSPDLNRSNRSSPSSSTCCARPPREQSTPFRRDRRNPQRLYARRTRQLPPKLRLPNINSSCSN
jgi:transposase